MEFSAVGDIGTVGLLTLIYITYRVIIGHFWCRYGYQALATWAGVGLMIVLVRVLRDNFGLISPQTAAQTAAISYVVALVILFNVVRAERRFHRIVGRNHNGEGETT